MRTKVGDIVRICRDRTAPHLPASADYMVRKVRFIKDNKILIWNGSSSKYHSSWILVKQVKQKEE